MQTKLSGEGLVSQQTHSFSRLCGGVCTDVSVTLPQFLPLFSMLYSTECVRSRLNLHIPASLHSMQHFLFRSECTMSRDAPAHVHSRSSLCVQGLGLVFVAVYQKALSLLYVDELLQLVKQEFTAHHFRPNVGVSSACCVNLLFQTCLALLYLMCRLFYLNLCMHFFVALCRQPEQA